jgi:hypothetical protein
MGANLLVAGVTLLLQFPPTDSTRPSQPSDTVPDQPTAGFGFERLSDLLQYNRVQGLSLGAGYRLPLPGVDPAILYGTVRYGFSDERVTGRLSLARDSPRISWSLSGYHDVIDLDPFSPGRSVSNTFNSLFAGHDNGDYALADGVTAKVELPVRRSVALTMTARVEDEQSTAATAHSSINDFLGGSGDFPPNPPIKEGMFGSLAAGLSGVGSFRWNVVLDGWGGEGTTTGRLYGDLRRSFGRRRWFTFRLKAGIGTEPGLPQTLFRLGGIHTVRGFEYATLRSAAFWAGQLDLAPIEGRVRPVLFIDAGQGDRTGDLLSSKALVGGGVGLSLFHGLVRFDFSLPISPDTEGKVRFDLIFQGVR